MRTVISATGRAMQLWEIMHYRDPDAGEIRYELYKEGKLVYESRYLFEIIKYADNLDYWLACYLCDSLKLEK